MKSRALDIKGRKFGRLMVIKREYPNTKLRAARWLCKCECGNEAIVSGSSLRRGLTKSCGCLQKDLLKIPFGLASMRRVICTYQIAAKKRGIEYNLTEEQFANITKQNCYYCGILPNQISNQGRHNGSYIHNGIDRVDNTKGYSIDNVVPCCKTCNIAKNTSTLQEFKDWIIKIYNKTIKGDINE